MIVIKVKEGENMKKILLSIVLILGMQNVVMAESSDQLTDKELKSAVAEGYQLCNANDEEFQSLLVKFIFQPIERVKNNKNLAIQYELARQASLYGCTLKQQELIPKPTIRLNTR